MLHKALQHVPIKELEFYYNRIEGVLDIEAYQVASKLAKPFTPAFDELQLRIFDAMVLDAMLRQFIGTNPIKGQL